MRRFLLPRFPFAIAYLVEGEPASKSWTPPMCWRLNSSWVKDERVHSRAMAARASGVMVSMPLLDCRRAWWVVALARGRAKADEVLALDASRRTAGGR